jgi:hypothetical protein
MNNNNKPKRGAFDVHPFAPWSLFFESFGFSAPFDYTAKSWILDRANYLFVTDDGIYRVGHDMNNYGNFLWGAATYIMGIPQLLALAGAHMNNLIKEPGFTFDSPDDQYSIKLGRRYAKEMKFRTNYGGRKNIFR